MKAIQYIAFGDSSVLKLVQVPLPDIKEDEILIKVEAITVNPLDIKIRSGSMQKMMPVELPWIPGSDATGRVEAIGSKVTRFKVGDKVVATGSGGTYAEYASAKENRTALRAENSSAAEAVALAVPLTTAGTILMESGKMQKGQRLFIQGAAGAVGSTMLQIAKEMGVYVIGSASGNGVEQIKALGADEAVDYKTQDVTQFVKDVDVVADLAGGPSQARLFEILKKGGKLLSIVMPPSAELAEKYDVTAQFVLSNPTFEKLEYGKKLIETGRLKPQISKIMELEQAAEAQDLLSKGGVNGKIVLEV